VRVLHITTGLGQGGAESALYKLVRATTPQIEHFVVSLLDEGVYGERLRAAGAQVEALRMRPGRPSLSALRRLQGSLRSIEPDLVQTWMYHADLLGGLAARFAGRRPIVWGVRHSNLELRRNRLSTLAIARVCAWLSNWVPTAIVFCAEQAAHAHAALGYRKEKFRIIPNGYDLATFATDPVARSAARLEWAGPQEVLLGCVARWHPQKDHENLLAALALVTRGTPVKCVLAGEGMTAQNPELMASIRRHGVERVAVLAGARNDIPTLMAAIDIHVLPSAGESFPNVVAEAMAAGTPCVATDVGDVSAIVGDTGWVVPARDPLAFAAGIEAALEALRAQGKAALGERCRERIERRYGLARMSGAYVELWRSLVDRESMRHAAKRREV
jgi:glycosyltransferase involved in cell wall biosynthesis